MPAQGHNRWRIYCTATKAPDLFQVSEVQMRASAGGADQCSGGVADASSNAGGSYVPANAFDDNTGTNYASGSSTMPQWLEYTFATRVSVLELYIRPRDGSVNSCPKDFKLQWSDDGGITWNDQFSITGVTDWVSGTAKTFTIPPEVVITSPVSSAQGTGFVASGYTVTPDVVWEAYPGADSYSVYLATNRGADVLLQSGITDLSYTPDALAAGFYTLKVVAIIGGASVAIGGVCFLKAVAGAFTTHLRWRIKVIAVAANQEAAFAEIEMRESIGGADVTGTGTATADSDAGGSYNAPKATDDNTSTAWQSANSALPHWIALAWAAAKGIIQISMRPRDYNKSPTSFALEYSDDGGSTWTTAWTLTGETGRWGNPSTRTFGIVYIEVATGVTLLPERVEMGMVVFAPTLVVGAPVNIQQTTRVNLPITVPAPALFTGTPIVPASRVELGWSVIYEPELIAADLELEYEFYREFAALHAAMVGTSITRRPDAVSLNYLTAFSPGPIALQDTSEGLAVRPWRARYAGGYVYLACGDGGTGWQQEIRLSAYLAGIAELDLAFTQNADPVIVAEKDGHLWIYWFDPLVPGFVWQDFGPGRTPRVVLDDLRTVLGTSDVQVFYVSDAAGSVLQRQQRDRYAQPYEVPIAADRDVYLEDVVTGRDRRLHIVYSTRDRVRGRYELGYLSSHLFPIFETLAFGLAAGALDGTLVDVIKISTQDPASWSLAAGALDGTLAEVLLQHDVLGEMDHGAVPESWLDEVMLESKIHPSYYSLSAGALGGTLVIVVFERTLDPVEFHLFAGSLGGTLV